MQCNFYTMSTGLIVVDDSNYVNDYKAGSGCGSDNKPETAWRD